MAYVVTDSCTKDALCVYFCPVDCIHPRKDEPQFETATQMYVNPAECIDCGACVPVCTSDSIHPADNLPEEKREFIQKNAAYFGMTTAARLLPPAGPRAALLDVRTGQRFPLRLPITISNGQSPRKRKGTTANISAAGVYVRAKKPLKVGSRVSFDITLPGPVLGAERDVKIRCAGRVVRAESSRGVSRRRQAARERLRGVACVIDQYRFIRNGTE